MREGSSGVVDLANVHCDSLPLKFSASNGFRLRVEAPKHWLALIVSPSSSANPDSPFQGQQAVTSIDESLRW